MTLYEMLQEIGERLDREFDSTMCLTAEVWCNKSFEGEERIKSSIRLWHSGLYEAGLEGSTQEGCNVDVIVNAAREAVRANISKIPNDADEALEMLKSNDNLRKRFGEWYLQHHGPIDEYPSRAVVEEWVEYCHEHKKEPD